MDSTTIGEGGVAETLLASIPDLSFVLDAEGDLQWWNDRVPEVTGYDDAALEGMGLCDLVAPASRETVTDALHAIRAGVPGPRKFPLQTADGERLCYEFNSAPVAGDGECIACIARDIGGREAHERERERLKTVTEAIRDGVYVLDGERRWQMVNEGLCEMLGYAREEMLGHTTDEFLADSTDPTVFRERELVLTGAVEVGTAEMTFTHSEGNEVITEVRFVRTELDDGSVGTTGVIRDVTERRERERWHRRQERQYRTLAENLPNGTVSLFERDDDGEIRYSVVAGSTLAGKGFDPDEIQGKRLEDAHSEWFYGAYGDTLRGAIEGESASFEFTDGEYRFVAYVLPVRDEDGTVLSGMLVSQDITEHHERAQRLRRQERQYRTLAENLPNGSTALFERDGDHLRYTLVAGGIFDEIDLDVEDLDGEFLRDVHTDAFIEHDLPRYWAALDGESNTFEVTFGDRDYQAFTLPVRDADGTVMGGLAMTQDMSKRKARERELEQYQRIVETVSDGVYALDDERRFIMVNDAFCELTGYAREEVLGAHTSLVVTESDLMTVETAQENLLSGKTTIGNIDLEILRADGEAVPVETRIAAFPLAEGNGRVGVCRDVTERRARERELEQFETLLESIDEGAYMVDEDYTFLTANTALAEMLGMEREELIGQRADDMLEQPVLDHSEQLRDRIRTGESDVESTEFELTSSDGRTIPVDNRFCGLFDETGTFVGTAGTVRDISERKAREEQLRRQRDELETLNRIHGATQDVVEALVDAGTREELEEAVCDHLVASSLYDSVWVGRHEGGSGAVVPQTAVGPNDDFIDLVTAIGSAGWDRPATQCARTGEEQVVCLPEDADAVPGSVIDLAESAGIASGAAIPISYRGTVHGVLVIYSPRRDAFSERELGAFLRLGRVIGFAIQAVRAKRLLLADTVTELEFTIPDADIGFGDLTAKYDCRIEMEWALPIDDGKVIEYLAVEGCPMDDAVDELSADPNISECRVVERHGDGGVLEVTVGDSVVTTLLDAGASVSSIHTDRGVVGVTAEVSQDTEVRSVVSALTARFSGTEMVAKRTTERPVQTARELRETVTDRLTEKQAKAIKAAFHAGYFDWPRQHTAEEIADSLSVTSATLHYHLRHAEHELIATFVDS